MSFVELQRDQPAPDTLPPRSRLAGLLSPIVLPVIILFNLCPPLARLLGERTTHVEGDGWLAEWTTARLLCPYCGARVRRFEFAGQPVPIPPRWHVRGPGPAPALATPVGVFMVCKGRWRRGHWEPSRYIVRGMFGTEDRTRGCYPTEFCDADGNALSAEQLARMVGVPVHRKTGTPADWCLLEGPQPHWLDPRRLAELADTIAAEAEDLPGASSARS